MFDMLQMFSARTIVEAHGKKWIVCYAISTDPKEGFSLYLAVPYDDEPLPAVVQMIKVDTKPLAEQRAYRELKKREQLTEAFRWEHAKLAKKGVCDATDGAEYQRVLAEWHEAGNPEIEPFIRERANTGPR